MANPVVTITEITAVRISCQPTKDVSDIKFTADKDAYAYEVRAVLLPGSVGQGIGILVDGKSQLYISESTIVSESTIINEYLLTSGVEQPADITCIELIDGDGDYDVAVYVKDEDGNWSG